MSKFIKDSVKEIEISGIRQFNEYANSFDNVLKLTIGELDFNTPISIKEKAIKAINNNQTRYTTNKGIESLRTKIGNKYGYTSDEVILTVGTTEGLHITLSSIIDKDDEVIIITPSYVGYKPLIDIYHGKTVLFDSLHETITKENLQKLVTSKTKAIITTSPNNPTGYVLTKTEMDEISSFVLENDILLISDEIYSTITFDTYHSFSEYKELKKNLIILDGFSKSHAMTGFRIGYVVGDESIVKHLVKVHQYSVTSTSTISQFAALEAVKTDNKDMVNELEERRNIVLRKLDSLGISYIKPNGAFYVFFDVLEDSITFCKDLVKETGVALIPGDYFLGNTSTFVRLAYSVDKITLLEALDRIETFIKKRKS